MRDYTIAAAIGLIDKQIQRLEDAKKVLELMDSGEIMPEFVKKPETNSQPSGNGIKRADNGIKRTMSKQARASIAAAQKKRWAAYRESKEGKQARAR